MEQPKKNKKKEIDDSLDTNFLTNWYNNRNTILDGAGNKIPVPKKDYEFAIPLQVKNFGPGQYGEFNPQTKSIDLSENYEDIPGIITHEKNHFVQNQMGTEYFNKYVEQGVDNTQDPMVQEYLKKAGKYGRYLIDPYEVHSRIMQFRQLNKFDPKDVIDQDTLKKSKGKSFLKLDMYDDNQLMDLLNKTVQVDSKTKDNTQVAKYGGSIKSKDMKKRKSKNNLPMYDLGSIIENPNTSLAENNINMAKASQKSNSNAWVNGLNIVGNLAMQQGKSMMAKGVANGEGADVKDLAGFLNKNNGDIGSLFSMLQGFSTQMAMGGKVPNAKVEVEGKELAETPGGNLLEFKGASHEQGGIPMELPEGTEVFSKRLKVDGKSMAERKKKRERVINNTTKLLEEDSTDKILKNTYKRIKMGTELEETKDKAAMEFAQQMSKLVNHYATGGRITPRPSYAFGSTIEDPLNPLINKEQVEGYFNNLPIGDNASLTGANTFDYTSEEIPIEEQNKEGLNLFGDITLGDGIGLAGDLVSTFGPMKNTLNNRASDTPNINSFKDYGKEGLQKLEESKQFEAGVRDNKLKDLELTRASTIKRGRNSARSINTMRSLDLAADMGINNAKSNVYNQYAQTMQAILSQQAQFENIQDQVVMQGENQRDLADRQDKDNFYTNLAKDISTKGTGLQKIGSDVNQIKQRKVGMNLLNQLSDKFKVNNDGSVTAKDTGTKIPQSEISKLSKEQIAVLSSAHNTGYNVTAKNGKLVYTGTNIEYDPQAPNKKYNRRK